MGYVGLTKDEADHLLVLLEGDTSDVEIEESDDEIELEVSSRSNSSNVPPLLETVPYDMIPTEQEFDSEDDLPLSYFQKKPKKKYSWRQKDLDQVDSQCTPTFSEPPNPEMTPLQYFKYFFDDGLITEIAYQTNLYSVQKKGTSINTTVEEIEQFLGMQILSGIVKMPSYRMYWAEGTRYAPIADIMSRNRFDNLRTFLHLSDNTLMKDRNDPGYDKLFKVRPVIDSVRANLATLSVEEHHSVDEIIIPFKGRSSLKQYVQNKPHKWGIKMFARAGSSGIIYDFEIYIGKGTVTSNTDLGISGDVVMRLCEKLPRYKNYKLYCDNWFTSLGILPTGTIRSNRLPNCDLKCDKDLKKEGRGSFDWRTEKNTNLNAVKWYDSKAVYLLSTYKGVEPIETVKRWSVADKQYIEVQRPDVVKHYNSSMGGVDLHDMLVSLYRINFVVKRYYLRIFFNLVDMCVVNAWLLYRRHMEQNQGKKTKTLVVFRSEIANGLLKAGKDVMRKRGRPSSATSSPAPTPPPKKHAKVSVPVNDVRYDRFGHFPVHIEPKQRCRLCIQAYSRIMCEKCKMALCLTKDKNCFKLFHCNK